MKKLINRVYNWFYNDWKVEKVFHGQWNIDMSSDMFAGWKETKHCRFEIHYSELEGKYRFRCYGFKPKDHKMYWIALNYYNNLKINLPV